MSLTIAIHTSTVVDINDLYHFLQSRLEFINAVQKSEEGFYFYQDKSSVRGVDFWQETYGYEVRMTILSSDSDRKIVEWILVYFISFVGEATFYVDDEHVKKEHILSTLAATDFTADATLIKTLVEHQGETITLFGPKGEFYIGPKVLEKIELNKEAWEDRLMALILLVQYELESSESDNVLKIGDDDDKKILKVVSREVAYLLKKYDYLVFSKNKNTSNYEDMLLVTNEILNQHLPDSWHLIDEYTIVAKALSTDDYDTMVKDLIPFDCKKELA